MLFISSLVPQKTWIFLPAAAIGRRKERSLAKFLKCIRILIFGQSTYWARYFDLQQVQPSPTSQIIGTPHLACIFLTNLTVWKMFGRWGCMKKHSILSLDTPRVPETNVNHQKTFPPSH